MNLNLNLLDNMDEKPLKGSKRGNLNICNFMITEQIYLMKLV